MKNQETSSQNPWTILKLLNWATEYLDNNQIENPKVTAEILLACSLGLRRIDLYLQYDRPLNKRELAEFKILFKRKLEREPVAYIVGNREFWSIPLSVTRDVLIPRPETECLIEAVLVIIREKRVDQRLRVLELGTGSGAVIIALASEKRENAYYATDVSNKALAVAKQNASQQGLNDIHFFAADWMAPLSRKNHLFDMIISNPPYVPSRQIERLSPEIRRYEPISALDGGEDGLDCLKHIVQNAWTYLAPHGWLLLEIGFDQKEDMIDMAASSGQYEHIEVLKDYSGNDRIAKMRRKTHGMQPVGQ